MVLNLTETVLRDANQSLIATRLRREQFEGMLEDINQAGYYSVECWGGAIFDSCIRYLNEDPWERLKYLRKRMPDAKLQMLLRGQSLLGYHHYSDDVVRKFVDNSVDKGIDIIRIFDALNDIRNIEVAVEETNRCGAHPSCAISYTVSPVHSVEKYLELAKQMENVGAQSICIKDMSGILSPNVAYELISKLKKTVSVPIILHSHCSTGYAYMTYLKAIEAGVDVLDTAISSFSGGTSQPATEVIAKVAEESGRSVNVKPDILQKINEQFSEIQEENIKEGLLQTKVLMTRPKALENQIPGGMYSNLLFQLKAQGAEDKMGEVLDEVVNVRKDLGYPPLVTPVSQMVGTQATVNVLMGGRYKQVIEEIKAYFRGEYGTPSGEVNKELMKSLVGVVEFPKERYALSLPKVYELEKQKEEHADYGRSDILTTIVMPGLGEEFLQKRDNKNGSGKSYHMKKTEKKSSWKNITNTMSSETKALLTAIALYKLKRTTNDIVIKNFYEMEK